MLTVLTRHPVPAYFALTFAISWGGALIAIGPGGIPDTRAELERVLPTTIAAMIVGPALAGLLMTGLVHGRAGLRALLSRLLTWRVAARWYAVALLTAPVVTIAMLLGLSLVSPEFMPGLFVSDDKASVLLFGTTAGLAVGILEELGWTGFAVPALRLRHSLLATGLIVGVLWGAWHILGNVILASGTYAGSLPQPIYLIERTVGLLIGGLPAFRVLMLWVYDRTGSLLVAVLMHASLTICALTLEPLGISGRALLVSDAVSVIVWWIVVAAVAAANGWHLRAQPLRARPA